MNWGMIGAGVVMGIAAIGSAIGIGIAEIFKSAFLFL